MLNRHHSIIEFDRNLAFPDRLTRKRHAHYVDYARGMIAIYSSGAGRMRKELHQSVQNLLAAEPDCDTRRIAALCKLLDESGTFDTDRRGSAAKLRLKVFRRAATYHPLVTSAEGMFESSEAEVKSRIAAELGQPWEQIDAALYSDVIEMQRLVSFDSALDAPALLARYNVGQLQAALYRARRASIRIRSDFKTVIRYIKLAHLLHEIHRTGEDEYRIDLSGPSSLLRDTSRYGVNFARFLPAMLACADWSFQAELLTPWGRPATLRLSSDDGYQSHLPPLDQFDSSIEERFAEKFGPQRDGWQLLRESAILHAGQTAYVPDFVFRRDDGTEIFFEIVGYWTPEYLEAKRQTLRLFRDHRILIALPHRSLRPGAAILPGTVTYKTALKVRSVLDALAAMVASG